MGMVIRVSILRQHYRYQGSATFVVTTSWAPGGVGSKTWAYTSEGNAQCIKQKMEQVLMVENLERATVLGIQKALSEPSVRGVHEFPMEYIKLVGLHVDNGPILLLAQNDDDIYHLLSTLLLSTACPDCGGGQSKVPKTEDYLLVGSDIRQRDTEAWAQLREEIFWRGTIYLHISGCRMVRWQLEDESQDSRITDG
ncbi:hypothetical protein FISHEDRAFT_56100 [Fistulina hepatica ATCC 64428]|uniref:Uncharacterized protein n=1 Tax=Fistulina hepatica ATCC 64428 TaxID=1128425 RepID=A0A0D7ALC8_9AGAR|nr:hypothetical protein FISHEDRAFT_56100 [Fistulina hepatica ATCC 64428]